jgi:ribosomal protein L28
MVGRTPTRVNVCTSCLKAGKVTKAVRSTRSAG